MKIIRFLLIPISLVYGIVTWIRNLLYDANIFKAYKIPTKSIVIGNLSMGGTGKTPHVMYLANLLKNDFKISILSRGYGRSTKGYKEVFIDNKSQEVGDEPLSYKKKYGNQVQVVVSESRQIGVQNILKTDFKEIVLLDDAFQHRKVTGGLNILLTDFNDPYYSDFMLPTGRLREFTTSKKRADILIVTKSPTDILESTKKEFKLRLNFQNDSVFFSSFIYDQLICFSKINVENIDFKNVLLVTGIANPKPLYLYLEQKYKVELLSFSDHYEFTEKDIQKIHEKFNTFAAESKVIITTEKDFMRLSNFDEIVMNTEIPWCYQTIEVVIDEQEKFNSLINNYVRKV